MDGAGNPISYADIKLRKSDGKHYLDLCQKNDGYVVKSYEVYYEQIRLPEKKDFTILDEASANEGTGTVASTASPSASPSVDEEEQADIKIKWLTIRGEDCNYVDSTIEIEGLDRTPENIHLTASGKTRWDSMKYVALPENSTCELTCKR